MFKVVIVADEAPQIRELSSELVQNGFTCSIIPDDANTLELVTMQAPKLVLVDMSDSSACSGMYNLQLKIKQEKHLPIIALLSKETLGSLDPTVPIDDFVIEPWDADEVAARAKLVLWQTNNLDSNELIKCGDLLIDLGKCEVSVDGNSIMLTFKEYELLRFLVNSKGRVFTRDALLNKVWGYDYFGGERTVDVHIRRLRSKIEDSTHTFIETVRNIGYKFKES